MQFLQAINSESKNKMGSEKENKKNKNYYSLFLPGIRAKNMAKKHRRGGYLGEEANFDSFALGSEDEVLSEYYILAHF